MMMEDYNYMAWCEAHGQKECDARKISAYDAESAAKLWARLDDRESAEYSIVSGNETIVSVKEIASGIVEEYIVYGEPVPSYYAKKIVFAPTN
jgi:hypothetical protein